MRWPSSLPAKRACWWASRQRQLWRRAAQIAREEAAAGRSAVIVTVLPDSADNYLSERFWEEGMIVLRVTKAVYDAIRAHGEETYPHECCGALLGRATADGWRLKRQ